MSSTQILKLPDTLDEAVQAVEAQGSAKTLTVHIRKPSKGEDAAQVLEAASRVTLDRLIRYSTPYEAAGGASSIGPLLASADASWEDILLIEHQSVSRGKGAARGAIKGTIFTGAIIFALGALIEWDYGTDDYIMALRVAGYAAIAGGAVGALVGVGKGFRRTVIWRR